MLLKNNITEIYFSTSLYVGMYKCSHIDLSMRSFQNIFIHLYNFCLKLYFLTSNIEFSLAIDGKVTSYGQKCVTYF